MPYLENSISSSSLKISESLKQAHYPSLNGIRGVSIILVVFSHLAISKNGVYQKIFNGPLGVNIFFVLSGFLITTLCMKEKSITGKLSLKSFYIRRILRIFPVAYLYLIVLFLLNFFCRLNIAPIQFLGAGLYIMDFSYFRKEHFSWFTGHYWSLSVEEQFYLIFPFFLKTQYKLFVLAVIFVVFLLPVFCTLQEFMKPLNAGVFYAFSHFFIKFQSIAVGCLYAILAYKGYLDLFFIKRTKVIANLIAIVLIIFLRYEDFYSIKAIYINLIIALLTGYLIISNINPAEDLLFKFLNLKGLSYIGVLSYSIYIWQQLFLSKSNRLPAIMICFPYNLILIFLIAWLSFTFYERYFLKLKTRFLKMAEQYKHYSN